MIKIPIKFSLSFPKRNQIGLDSSFLLPVQVLKITPAGAGSSRSLLPVQVPQDYSCRRRFLHFEDNKD